MGIPAKEVTKGQNIKYNKSHTVTFTQKERFAHPIAYLLTKYVKTEIIMSSLILNLNKYKTEGEEVLLLQPSSFSTFHERGLSSLEGACF